GKKVVSRESHTEVLINLLRINKGLIVVAFDLTNITTQDPISPQSVSKKRQFVYRLKVGVPATNPSLFESLHQLCFGNTEGGCVKLHDYLTVGRLQPCRRRNRKLDTVDPVQVIDEHCYQLLMSLQVDRISPQLLQCHRRDYLRDPTIPRQCLLISQTIFGGHVAPVS